MALLDAALCGAGPSVVALLGPGGQGKTPRPARAFDRLLRRKGFYGVSTGQGGGLCPA